MTLKALGSVLLSRYPTVRFRYPTAYIRELWNWTTLENSRRPRLCRETLDGSEENIQEEDLYRFSRYRWVCDEQKELSKRYLKFNLESLLDAAVKVVGNGAQRCVKVLKYAEGLNNKVFLLTMDNEKDIVVKLPNPNAGPVHLTTASQVATQEFLREVLQIPVPQVYGWSSNRHNPVGAEYIFEEKAPGRPLGIFWHDLPRKSKLDIIAQVADIEKILTSATFLNHGCIYFRQDLPGGDTAHMPLAINHHSSSDALARFTMGPLVDKELWIDEKMDMILDRGPWSTALDYVEALAKNEIHWVKSHAKPRMNYFRSFYEPELPAEYLELLKQYLSVARSLVPPTSDQDLRSATLWHPDLHLNNVFVDPETNKITCIVDWQSAKIAPLYLHEAIPGMFQHSERVESDWSVPQKPENYGDLSTAEKEKIDNDIESKTIHKYYKYQAWKKNPRHWSRIELDEELEIRRKPVALVTSAWKNEAVFFLRRALMAVESHWEELEGQSPCPIHFSESDLTLQAKEQENHGAIGQIMRLLRDSQGLPPDGMVDHANFQQARIIVEKFKTTFVNSAESEEERELYLKLWPYQDTEPPTEPPTEPSTEASAKAV